MTSHRVNEIDLLRFIAALLVVFFHYSFRGFAADAMTVMPYPYLAPLAKYGYLGVELFFIISGFVILMTAANGSLRSFVISRTVRLYPAFWACCTLSFIAIITLGEPRYAATIKQYLLNMTMLSGFIGVPSIDGAYWSLFVEIKFYLLVAIILIIGQIHNAQAILILWLISSLALETLPAGKLHYLLLVDYSAYFIAGATYFLIWSKGLSGTRATMIITAWSLAVFQSISQLSGFEEHYRTEMSAYVVAAIVSAFFLVMLLVSLRRMGFLGRQKWILAGALTYPLYLLHQNIGFIIFNRTYPRFSSNLIFWGTIVLVTGAAYAVHVLIEKRISRPFKNLMNNGLDSIQGSARRAYRQIKPGTALAAMQQKPIESPDPYGLEGGAQASETGKT